MQEAPQAMLVAWFSQLDDLTVLGILMSVAGAAILLYLWQGRRSKAEHIELALREEIGSLQRKIDDQASAQSVLGERVLALEEYLELVGHRQQQIESEKRDPRFYQQAIRMADQGLDVQALIERCGVSRSEAELIAAMRSTR